MKKIAIVQSNYIPWRGYLDLIAAVDEFVLLDDVQYTRMDWRNRNRIRGPQGSAWLTIPVETKGKYDQEIKDVVVANRWADAHWRSLEHAYSKAEHFRVFAESIRAAYAKAGAMERLSEINHHFLSCTCDLLGITTPLSWSMDYKPEGRKTDRLLAICKAAGASCYLSGPSAANYLEVEKFQEAGVAVEWMNYEGYPAYRQVTDIFDPFVSILDMLFNCGKESPHFMKYVRS